MSKASSNPPRPPLDTTIRLVTPERITFEYPLAGPFRRAYAYLVDLGIIAVILVAGLLVTAILASWTTDWFGLYLVGFFALQWGYAAVFEALGNGQTPGKRVASIRVVSVQGVPITGAQAFLRNILWPLDWALPLGFLPAIACMLLTSRFQRLGDMAAGTMVVVEHRPRRGGVVRLRDARVEALLPWLPSRVDAGPELSRALSDYVKHRGRFNNARREEMSDHLATPLRARHHLPEGAPNDVIVCALYHRVFVGE